MKDKKTALMVTLFCLLILPMFINITIKIEAPIPNWTIDGDKVYVNDSNVFIEVTPHTVTSGGWVNITFISKRHSGLVDFVFGSEKNVKPRKLELWNPHIVIINYSQDLSEWWDNPNYEIDLTWDSIDPEWIYNGKVIVYQLNGTDRIPTYEQKFDKGNRDTKIIYWHETKKVYWTNIGSGWDKTEYQYGGMDVWFSKTMNIKQNRNYTVRLFLEIPVTYRNLISGKYWIAIKLNSDTIQGAIDNNRFYFLDPWYDSVWLYRTLVTIDSGDIDANLTDFPVLVYLNSSRIDWANVRDTTGDIRFVSTDNTTLYEYELEKRVDNDWAVFWVKIPSISSSSDTTFYIYYGNTLASSVEDAEAVWNDGYVVVQHMDDNNSASVVDSTSNSNDGVKRGDNEPIETTSGMMDAAQDFDGSDDFINCSSGASIDAISTGFTLEAWIYLDEDQKAGIISKNTWYGFQLVYRADNDRMLVSTYTSSTNDVFGNVDEIELNTWYYTVATFEVNTSIKLYLDGVLDKENLTINAGNIKDHSAYDLWLGMRWSTANWVNGTIDEVRISNMTRSAAWIKASYESGRDDLLTYGSEETQVPRWSLVSSNTTRAGYRSKLVSYWESYGSLDSYIFSWNNSGSWVNQTAVAFTATPDWANVTDWLSSNVGYIIGWRIYANNSIGDWNVTDIKIIKTTVVSMNTGGYGGGLGMIVFGGLALIIIVTVRAVRNA